MLAAAAPVHQEQHSLQLFLGNPKYSKQLIINTLRDRVKDIPGHLEASVCENYIVPKNYLMGTVTSTPVQYKTSFGVTKRLSTLTLTCCRAMS